MDDNKCKDTCPEKFVDFDQCLKLIDDLESQLPPGKDDSKRLSVAEKLVEDFRKTIDKYQEQPELIEPHLPDLIGRLTAGIVAKSNEDIIQYNTTFKFLYQLIKVIGFKSVGKRFPHETDKLPMIVDLLAKENPENKQDWQTRFSLTVWLSIAILTPFDLAKFDAGTTDDILPIAERIYSTLLRSLSSHDSCQHATAYCLAKFLSRPDILSAYSSTNKYYLDEFLKATLEELSQLKEIKGGFAPINVKLIGHLRALAYTYKFLPRRELQSRSCAILSLLGELDMVKISDLVYHLLIKLVQRVGLTLLPKSLASWRYKRGARILGINQNQEELQSKVKQPASEHKTIELPAEEEKEEEELKATDWLESIFSMLFVAAQNGQTKIRWSAAKGIARLASRLSSRQRASDVLDMVLANFFDQQTSSEFAWHGGCLTLAEMSRQGLILEEKLEQVMRVISQAIIYDKIKGSFAVGAHVRESACYVIWAMARVYDDHHLRSYISELSINLMCTIVFDRELQCRRAASATFQELIGRQGTFDAEALSLLANVDYQNVGQRQFAYLDLSSRVARIGGAKFYEPFIEHLMKQKIGHWDLQIRRLASDSLGLLMLHPSAEYIEIQVLNKLKEFNEQSLDNNLKHGALLSLAKVIKCLVPLGYKFNESIRQLVGELAQKCDKQLKSKQQAANFLEAICQLITASEKAEFVYQSDSQTMKQWEHLVFQALQSDNSELRNVASDAYLSLYRFYFKHNKTCQDRLLTWANQTLASPNESSRCGALKCLAKLGLTLTASDLCGSAVTNVDKLQSFEAHQRGASLERTCPLSEQLSKTGGEIKLDSDTADIILMSLTGYLGRETREKSSEQVFAQAKAECCQALVDFVRLLDKSRLIISMHWLRMGLDALLGKTEDYTFDKRGDIGVQVRKASVKALQELCCYLISVNMSYPLLYEPGRLESIVAKMLQQCVSYNNAARELAGQAFHRLIGAIGQEDPAARCWPSSETASGRQLRDLVPHYNDIVLLFQKYQANSLDEYNWRDDSTPIFVELLGKPEYCGDLWLGLAPALGQASELCAKQFRDSLSDYIRKNLLCDDLDTRREGLNDDKQRRQLLEQVFESFLCLLEQTSGFHSSNENFARQQQRQIQAQASDVVAPVAVDATSQAPNSNAKLIPTTMGQQRFLTVGLQAVDYLLTQGLMNETSSKLQERLVELCWRASRICQSLSSSAASGGNSENTTTSSRKTSSKQQAMSQDPKRLVSVSRVLCSMLQFQSRQIQHKCLRYCLAFLASGLATVRAYTAEQLYSNIMFQQLDEEAAEQEEVGAPSSCSPDELAEKRKYLDEAMDLLSQTQWTEALEKVIPIREKICSCLGAFYSIDLSHEAVDCY